jgi:LysM repeat protein
MNKEWGSMKGRHSIAVFIAAAGLLLTSLSGYSKTPQKPSIKNDKRSLRQAPRLNSNGFYVMRKGDSLIKVARAFKTSPEVLMFANKLKSEKIKIGQEIRIPNPPTPRAKEKLLKTAEDSLASNELFISSAASPLGVQNKMADAGTGEEPLRVRLVKAGFEWIGVRYRVSGGSEKNGFDCSGLVKRLFSKFNIDLPRSSREQYRQGEKIDRDKLEAGDLVFFSSGGDLPTHVGIYIGDNKFLHAARKAKQVIVSDLNKFWYTMRYLGARRVMNLWWEEPGSTFESN